MQLGQKQGWQVGRHRHEAGALHAMWTGSSKESNWSDVPAVWRGMNTAVVPGGRDIKSDTTEYESAVRIGGETGRDQADEASPEDEDTSPESRPVNYAVHWIIRVE